MAFRRKKDPMVGAVVVTHGDAAAALVAAARGLFGRIHALESVCVQVADDFRPTLEKIARAQLNMRTATPAITQYVSDPQGAAATPAAAPASAAGGQP